MPHLTETHTILTIQPEIIHTTITPLQTSYFQILHAAIQSASTSIKICQYVFSATGSRSWQRSEKIFQALAQAKQRGIEISLLMDRPKPRSPNAIANYKTAKRLQEAGIQPHSLTLRTTLHIKLIIIDDRAIFTGSHNLTNSSLYSPLELSFMTTDTFLCHACLLYFASLWLSPISKPFLTSATAQAQADRD